MKNMSDTKRNNNQHDIPDDFNEALQLVVGAAMKVGGCNMACEEGIFSDDDVDTAYSSLANIIAAFKAKFNST